MRLLSETAEIVLPMAPIWYGVIALIIFAVSLAVTYAFRGAGNRHNPAAFRDHGDQASLSGPERRSLGSGH